MSIAPPGYEAPDASPPPPPSPAPQGARLSQDTQYEFKSVQALRGRENNAKAKWQNQGWEFVSDNRGTLRPELNFRRVVSLSGYFGYTDAIHQSFQTLINGVPSVLRNQPFGNMKTSAGVALTLTPINDPSRGELSLIASARPTM